MSSLRSRLRQFGVYFGLRPANPTDEPGPISLSTQLGYGVATGVAFALATWAISGGSTASIIARGVVFGALMATFAWQGERRRAKRSARRH